MLVYGNLESYLYAQCIYLVETQFQLIEYGFHRNSARRLVLQTWGVHGVYCMERSVKKVHGW
ncbi:unnamed protein product [Coffea canephora]|uniref:Uncharacterized protein n=1 Tax=Coffea canephora TaxID=49390 RepID=A0A068U4B8_COFCA|nr:unnamed protein product [Coffea canephora]